jgi:hypothetical protein
MRKNRPQLTRVKNQIPGRTRAIKGTGGIALLILAYYLVFGMSFDGENVYLLAGVLIVAFASFGFGWAFASQGIMGWSRQYEIDLDRRELTQVTASILGRSRPFVVPFVRIAGFQLLPADSSSDPDGRTNVELADIHGGILLQIETFATRAEAEDIVARIKAAVAEDADPDEIASSR